LIVCCCFVVVVVVVVLYGDFVSDFVVPPGEIQMKHLPAVSIPKVSQFLIPVVI
jgi:hypothetical protein